MNKDKSKTQFGKRLGNEKLILPALPEGLEASLGQGNAFNVDGTNVVRVPFGIRQARRKKPARPTTWATLVLPFQPQDNPTPPPQAA